MGLLNRLASSRLTVFTLCRRKSNSNHGCLVTPFASTGTVNRRYASGGSGASINNPGLLSISEEVKRTLREGGPVVALESTIISHGMPYPENLRTARNVERICREAGAVPATCAVIGGKLCVGLVEGQLEHLAKDGPKIMKTSSRDIPYVISQHQWTYAHSNLDGSLTVAGTLVAARSAGIKVMGTGGIGGVHRGATESMDVSADLIELSRSPVAVVCSGAKSILDIGLTLEYLHQWTYAHSETMGITVVKFGEDNEFPAFFTQRSGFKAPYHLQTEKLVAKMIDCTRQLPELRGGQLIAVPIPKRYSLDEDLINSAIDTAVKDASSRGIKNKDVTPFILARINKILDGKSLASNIALIENNAKVASKIALELCGRTSSHSPPILPGTSLDSRYRYGVSIMGEDVNSSNKGGEKGGVGEGERGLNSTTENNEEKKKNGKVVVVGAINCDMVSTFGKSGDEAKLDGTTIPGKIFQTFGGVGRNLATCMARLDQNVFFISAVGSDLAGHSFYQSHSNLMNLAGVETIEDLSTAMYVATVTSSGEILHGVGDFEIHSRISPQLIDKHKDTLRDARVVCVDGNIPAATIQTVVDICRQENIPVLFEPTDPRHTVKIFQSDCWQEISCATPNFNELNTLHRCVLKETGAQTQDQIQYDLRKNTSVSSDTLLQHCINISRPILDHIPMLLVTLGHHGILYLFTENALTSAQSLFTLSAGNRAALSQVAFSSRAVLPKQAKVSLNSKTADLPPEQDSTTRLKISLFQSGRILTTGTERIYAVHYPAVDRKGLDIVSVSGAGDCLAGAFVSGLLSGYSPDDSSRAAITAAGLSLRSHQTVPDTINKQSVLYFNKKSACDTELVAPSANDFVHI